MNAAQQVTTLRKAGHLDEALAVAMPALEAASDDLWLRRAVGWLFYDLIKRDVEGFGAGRVTRGQLIAHLDQWLREYARGGKADCPGLLHSRLLTQVLKVNKEWPRFLAFARWWDPACLRPEDREPVALDNGKTLASLELRLFYAVGRASSAGSDEQDPDLVSWGAELMDTALESHPNDQWLHYYKSKRLIGLGQTAEARKHLLPVLRRQRQASWAWGLFGRTWETEDPGKAITCYFRAIQVAGKDVEVVGTRVQLAQLLAKGERYAEAAVQVRAALACRETNDYRIPQDLAALAASAWYRRYADLPNLTREPDVAQAANALLFGAEAGDLVHRRGVIDNQNPEKALAHVVFGPDDGALLMYRAMKGVAKLAVGTCVEVGFVKGETRPVTYRLLEDTVIPGLCERFEGELSQRPGQAFAFVMADGGQRVFVHPSLANAVQGLVGGRVSCRAVTGKDKQGKLGWRAVSVDRSAQIDGQQSEVEQENRGSAQRKAPY
jgi:tetratricopeptide (TPR) repeat protein